MKENVFLYSLFPQTRCVIMASMRTIRIKTFPDSKHASVKNISPNRLHVYVREPAEENRANRAAICAVAKFYITDPKKLRILTGHHKPTKTIEIRD